MNLRNLDILDSNAIEQFKSLKGIVNNPQNDIETITKAQNDIDYISIQIALSTPNENEVMERLDFLSNVGGIQSYISDYIDIILRHFEAIKNI